MAGRFEFSRPQRRSVNDPWFRIGDVAIGSAALLALLCALSLVVYGLEGNQHPILRRLVLIPGDVFDGQVWRIVTWPLANGFGERQLLWTVITIALLWVFGTRLEEQIGRARMTTLLGALIVLPGIAATLLDIAAFGVNSVELAVLLIFVAEYPQLRFLFGIPAWAIGAVIVATDVLQILADGTDDQLLLYLISLVIAAAAARAVGLLAAYPFIPQLPLPASLTGERRPTTSRPRRSGSSRSGGSGTVVDGPWTAPPPPSRPSPTARADQDELDALLDKISAGGLDSLSTAQKQRLNELSKRLR